MKNVLVTGGAGYIGSHTCVELLNAGYGVISIDNYSNSAPESINKVKKITGKNIISFNCDIRDQNKLCEIFSKYNIDSVIHFAALKAVGESCRKPLSYYNNNILGLISLLEVINKFGVKKMIFSSSATVYGNNPVPYSEDMNTGNVTNPYGRTKYFSEQILSDLYFSDKKWNILLLRYFNPIGAHESGLIGEDPNGIPNNIMPVISKVAVGLLPKLTIFGNDYDTPDGTCIRDYIHVADLALGHVKALEKIDSECGILECFNLGTGKGNSVLELVNTFEKTNNCRVNYEIGDRRSGDIAVCYASAEKAKKHLNWEAKYDLERMCQDTWRFQVNNPNGY
ncbi:MAG: UDP-glucose 4-epimerase GalE [Oscillospiraceae bacterium]|jgi:UDP-glucose 4-epimerase|nr:UDP-glucose 4-epimerase GalE [Oscillospiraceae bacterium]